jgi:hypothetical protein
MKGRQMIKHTFQAYKIALRSDMSELVKQAGNRLKHRLKAELNGVIGVYKKA